MPTTSSGTPSPTSSSGPAANPSDTANRAGNKAWIAGAVVGPIACLGLFVTAYWLWMRHRNLRNRPSSTQEGTHVQIDKTEEAWRRRSELSADHTVPAFTVPASPAQSSELPV